MDRRGRKGVAGRKAPPTEGPSQAVALEIPLSYPKFLTVEMAAYVALFVLALAVRIGHLDAYPLDPSEAARALSAWQLIHGQLTTSWQEPLVLLLTALSFFALGDNDTMARLAPVAVGSGLVLLPWLLRLQVGRRAALLASLLLAVSPTFVFYSRTLSGDIFAAALSVGFLACILRYVRDRKPGWLYTGSGLLALLLNSGAPGISFLLVFAAYVALASASGRIPHEYASLWEGLKSDRSAIYQSAIALVGGFVLVGTGFLSELSGLRLPSLSEWVSEFNVVSDGRPWNFHLQLLLGYEPLIFLFGVAGAAFYVYRWRKLPVREPLGIKGFLAFWAAGGFVTSTFTGAKHGGQLLVIALPLALLAGSLIGELVAGIERRLSLRLHGLLAGSIPFVVFALLSIADATRDEQLAFWYQWLLAGLALILVAALVAAAVSYGGLRLGRYAALVGFALLLGYSVHATWRTAYATKEQEALSLSLTSPYLVDVVQEIDELATSQFLGKGISIAVDPSLGAPVRWYLRKHTSVQYTSKPQRGTQVIAWGADSIPDINLEDYFARKAKVTTSWSDKGGKLGGFWRWLIYREPYGVVKATEMMLYLRK